MYKEYVERIAGALQPLLALGTTSTAVALPPMPEAATAAAVRAWHVDVLRAQHASIADALSGKRLGTLTECVAMAVDGVDPGGRPLNVRDAAAYLVSFEE